MKLLVTGGMGFIGSHFIRHILNSYDYKVVNFDKLTYCGNPDNLRDVENNSNYSFVKGCICDAKLINDVMKDCDAVVHFAAETHVDRSIRNPYNFLMTDVVGTGVLLEAAKTLKVKKFVHISTDEVYGSINEGLFKETDPLNPNSPYSASKTGADRLARSFFITYGLPVVIARPSNNYGSHQFPEKFIPLCISNISEGKNIPLYGDGSNVRDWLYVLDNCRAIDILLHNGENGEAYNVGGENEIVSLDLAKTIVKELGVGEEKISFVGDREGHDQRYAVDNTKIRKLGWSPKASFNKQLKDTIQWYLNNKKWWQDCKKKGEEWFNWHHERNFGK